MPPLSKQMAMTASSVTLLSACMVMTPSPAIEAVNLVTSTLVTGASMQPGKARDAVAHPHEHIDEICIEVNPDAPFHDFVAAVQTELRKNGIDSRLYDAGSYPLSCRATLDYSAFLDWDRRALSDDYSPYLIHASFTLRSNGRVLASSSYEQGQLDKWASTRTKISGAVKELLAGN
jgi:hypothetical protein